jgi:hypothetical protein
METIYTWFGETITADYVRYDEEGSGIVYIQGMTFELVEKNGQVVFTNQATKEYDEYVEKGLLIKK